MGCKEKLCKRLTKRSQELMMNYARRQRRRSKSNQKISHHICIQESKYPHELHLKVDWSHLGVGYLFYAGERKHGAVVGLGSKGAQHDCSCSYLGELSGVV